MKFKTSKKTMRDYYGKNLYCVGYCDLSYLLYYKNASAYSCGVYGWSCDYYELENICISTGYSPIGKRINYELTKKYNDKARELINSTLDYEEVKQKLNQLIKEFIQEIKNN